MSSDRSGLFKYRLPNIRFRELGPKVGRRIWIVLPSLGTASKRLKHARTRMMLMIDKVPGRGTGRSLSAS